MQLAKSFLTVVISYFDQIWTLALKIRLSAGFSNLPTAFLARFWPVHLNKSRPMALIIRLINRGDQELSKTLLIVVIGPLQGKISAANGNMVHLSWCCDFDATEMAACWLRDNLQNPSHISGHKVQEIIEDVCLKKSARLAFELSNSSSWTSSSRDTTAYR